MKKYAMMFLLGVSILGIVLTVGFVVSGNTNNTIVFEDVNLEYVIRRASGDTSKQVLAAQAESITELDASNSGINNLKGIEKLSNLKKLNLEGNEIKDVSPLSSLAKLEELNLNNNGIISLEKIRLDTLGDLPNLKKLSLENNSRIKEEDIEVKLSEITALGKLTKLEALKLKGNDIKDISPLGNLKNLKELDLSENRISDESIATLGSLTGLERLNLRECDVRDISCVENLSNLVYLNIHSNVNIKSIMPVAKLTKLKSLIMRNVPVGDQINALENLTNLYDLNIRNTSVTDISVLVKLIEKGALQDKAESKIIADVDIRDNPIPILEGASGYDPIRPYWNNIKNRNPDILPENPVLKVFINEVMASNVNTIANKQGEYEDWIELYNPNDRAVDLTGYYLSDNEKKQTKWQFPKNSVIPAKGYLLVWASGKEQSVIEKDIHANFKISADGETVILTQPDGKTIVDFFIVYNGQKDVSCGRIQDGDSRMECFDINNATPGRTNNNARGGADSEGKALTPKFSRSGGFYDEEFLLELSTEDKDAVIYYTLDGSEPDPKNIDGAGDSYNVKYSYRNNVIDNKDGPLENKKKITYKYDGRPIEIKSRKGEPNFLSEIATAINFKKPLGEVDKAYIVRAKAYKGEMQSETVTNTFFVEENIKNKHSLPVISIVTDSENLFDYEKGIYVPGKIYDENYDPGLDIMRSPANYKKHGDKWERPAHIEFFENVYTLGFSQNVGIRIHGGASRTKAQKSLRIQAGYEYDTRKDINYRLFPDLTKAGSDEPVSEFRSVILRNSGNDGFNTMFRDALAQSLLSHTTVDTQAYRPSIVYLNGEYWGIHNIRERYDEHYLKNTYDVDPDDVVILENNAVLNEGVQGDEKHYKNMIDFMLANDMSLDTNYEYIKTQMDVENFMDYYLSCIYFGNTDWPHNNIKFWRLKTTGFTPDAPFGHDGRWRWLMYDQDYSFGCFYDASFNTLDWAVGGVNPKTGEEWPNILINSLLQNESFKTDFINRFADHINTTFKKERVVKQILDMYETIKPEMKEYRKRWGVSEWEKNVQKMIDYAKVRPDVQRQHIVDFFELDGTVKLNLISDSKRGCIKVNHIEINKKTPGVENPDKWTGVYFKNIPVSITAIPEPGYSFDGWVTNIEGHESEKSPSLTIRPDRDIKITAIFKISSSAPAERLIEALPMEKGLTLNDKSLVESAEKFVERTLDEAGIKESDIKNINKLTRLKAKIRELEKIKEDRIVQFGPKDIVIVTGVLLLFLLIVFHLYRNIRRKWKIYTNDESNEVLNIYYTNIALWKLKNNASSLSVSKKYDE